MGTLQRSATQAAKTSPAIAEPPIPIRETRWASAIGARALPSAQIAAAEIWSGSDAMMSRIPPGSTRATARASSIPDGMGPAEIRPPSSELETKKLVLTIILIYPAGLQTAVDLQRAIEALRAGAFILVYDGDGREAETDLTIASEFVSPASIRTLRKEAGGLICMTLSGEVRARIGLPFMADVLRRATDAYPVLGALSTEDIKYDRHSAFSISVNHRDTFTGVTDIDRAKTISRLAGIAKEATKRENGWAADVFANEFRSPGHVPLLNAAEPLLAERRGHTELTTALMIMAGLAPTATICEMVEALKPVDRAVLGHEGNIYDILEEIRPDIIAIGYDQVHSEERILEECRKRGLATKVVRLPRFEGDLVGTRKIVRKVAEWLALQERLSEVERAKPRGARDHPPSRRRKRNA